MSARGTLETFLADHPTFGGWDDTWAGVPLSFQVGLSSELPPREFVASVRALVLRGEEVLLVHDTPPHLTLGGRPEPGETLEAALVREVLEESGWHALPLGVIGFAHARHTDAQRPDWGRPAPDFVDVFYAARALGFEASALEPGLPTCTFIPVREVGRHGIEEINRTLLETALMLRSNR